MKQPIEMIEPQNPDGSFDLLCDDYDDIDEIIQEYVNVSQVYLGGAMGMSETNEMLLERDMNSLTDWMYANYPAVAMRIDAVIIKRRLEQMSDYGRRS